MAESANRIHGGAAPVTKPTEEEPNMSDEKNEQNSGTGEGGVNVNVEPGAEADVNIERTQDDRDREQTIETQKDES